MRLQPGKIRASHQHFNPRTRTGCDQVVLHGFRRQNISIHAPARGATHLPSSLAYIATFQSTHPHGVRLWRMDDSDVPADFNPRTRTGCDSTRRGESQGSSVFQSTHPHGVRLRIRELETGIVDISIHAPARGATIILRPPYRRCRYFNPRTRTGCDLVLAENTTTGNLISIHAPARGATHGVSLDLLPCRFQSTHPHGVRPMSASSWSSSSVFQSTHPHGVRLSDAREWDREKRIGVRASTYFNPRTRTGCDTEHGGSTGIRSISIHAPARGATCIREALDLVLIISIHAPARGATVITAGMYSG